MNEKRPAEDAHWTIVREEARDAADKIAGAAWRAALVSTNGNIAAAAEQAGIDPRVGRRLTVRHGLSDFARELRVAAGVSESGMGNPHGRTG